MNKLVTLFAIHEVGQALRPGVLEFNKNFHQFNIVLELRIHYLDVLLVFFQQSTEVSKGLLYTFGQRSHGFGLVWADPSKDAFGCHQYVVGQVIPAHTFRIGDRVNFS